MSKAKDMKLSKSTRPRVLLVVRVILICKKKILLIQRSATDTSEPLMWEIPGGKLDIGEDLNTSPERELVEEVGILGQRINSLTYFDSAISTSKKYKNLPYIRLALLYRSNSDKVRLSNEHQEYKWVEFEEALNLDLTEFSRKALLAWEIELEKVLI